MSFNVPHENTATSHETHFMHMQSVSPLCTTMCCLTSFSTSWDALSLFNRRTDSEARVILTVVLKE